MRSRLVRLATGGTMVTYPLDQSYPEITPLAISAGSEGYRFTWSVRNAAGLPVAAIYFRSIPNLAECLMAAVARGNVGMLNRFLSNPESVAVDPPLRRGESSDPDVCFATSGFIWLSEGLAEGAPAVTLTVTSGYLPGATLMDVHSATECDYATTEPDPETDAANLNITGVEIVTVGPAFERAEGLDGLRKNIRKFISAPALASVTDIFGTVEVLDATQLRAALAQAAYRDPSVTLFTEMWHLALDALGIAR
ncbi:MAG: hypothetical protein ACKV22_19290 [Bryobacteraceae bacterium]